MSVGTHFEGKNTSGYRKVRTEGVLLFLDPQLFGLGESLTLDVRQGLRKKLSVHISHRHGAHCNHA